MQDVYLLLGSNLGDREGYLRKAIISIGREIGKVEESSSLYSTASWGKTDQPDYLNQVIHVKSFLVPSIILKKIISIEKELGRKRIEKWDSRTIDIDILFYGSEIIGETDLIIPHPYLHIRRFTLAPLNELIPEFNHPVLNRTIKDLLNSLQDSLTVCKIN